MHGIERIAEFVVSGWLLLNGMAMVLVGVGVARQYARAALARRDEQAGEVAFDQV